MSLADLYAVDADRRVDALDNLDRNTPGAAWAVRELVGDEDAPVRAAAVAWLGRARAHVVAAAVVDALYDEQPSVRFEACRSLARLDAPTEGRALLARLAHEEPIWWVRRAALLALARLEGLAAVPHLERALDDPFWRVRHAAIRALLALGAEDRDPVRAAIAAADPAGSERAAAALAYVARRMGVSVAAIVGDDARPPPSGAAADPDPAVTAARLESGARATLAELVEHVGDAHESLRRAASKRLQRDRDPRALLATTAWLAEPRIPHATEAVVRTLDGCGEAALDLAARLVGDPDQRPGASAWALSFLASAPDRRVLGEHLGAVIAACRARAPIARRAAVGAAGVALADLGDPAAFAALARAASDEDPDVRRLALHGLASARTAEAWTFASRAPIAGEPAVTRRVIARAAVQATALDRLRELTVDDDPEVRALALQALFAHGALDEAAIGSARASDDPWIRRAVLDEASAEAAMSDRDPLVVRAAFELRARSGDALPASRIAAASDDPWLRAMAASRLARSPDEADLRSVLRLARDAEPAVRAAAADATALGPDLAPRLRAIRSSLADEESAIADAWLREPMPSILLASPIERPGRAGDAREELAPPASPRPLGRTGLVISPLAISGAHEPRVGALFRAMRAGCNLFFWEPRYRSLGVFLREARARGARPHVVAGTYHASERAIRADVERALRRLGRDQLDVFLLFWARSPARLEGEGPRALARLRDEGLVRAVGFSTHDRELAERALGRDPWDVVMVRHSAAHPGAERSLFARAAETGVGVLGFSATSYGRLLGGGVSAADCYRYTLAQPGVSAVVSAPSWTREVVENLDVLRSPTLEDSDAARLRARGAVVREESLDFGRHVRRFPVAPEELLERELAAATEAAGL